MLLPSVKKNYQLGAYPAPPEPLYRKQEGNAQENARLRRLEDLRGLVQPARGHPMPGSPLGRHSGASTPNLHDFATKTHLARLDLAVESMDVQVQQCMQQMNSALTEQSKSVEEWVGQALTSMVANERGRSGSSVSAEVFGPVMKRLSFLEERAAASPVGESQLAARVALMENKLGSSPAQPASPSRDTDMHARVLAVEKKLASPPLESDVRSQLDAIANKLAVAAEREAELRARMGIFEEKASAGGADFQARLASSPPPQGESDLRTRMAIFDEKLSAGASREAELRARLENFADKLSAAAVAEAGVQGRLNAFDERLGAVASRNPGVSEDRLSGMSAKVVELQTSLEKAMSDMASPRPSPGSSHLKAAVFDLSAQFEEELAKINPALKEDAKDRETLRKDLQAIQKHVITVRPPPDADCSESQRPWEMKPAGDVEALKVAIEDLKEQVSVISNASDATSEKLDTAMGDLVAQFKQVGDAKSADAAESVQAVLRASAKQKQAANNESGSWKKATDDKMLALDEQIQQLPKVMADVEEKMNSMKGEHDKLARRMESAEKKLHLDELVQGLQTQILALQKQEPEEVAEPGPSEEVAQLAPVEEGTMLRPATDEGGLSDKEEETALPAEAEAENPEKETSQILKRNLERRRSATTALEEAGELGAAGASPLPPPDESPPEQPPSPRTATKQALGLAPLDRRGSLGGASSALLKPMGTKAPDDDPPRRGSLGGAKSALLKSMGVVAADDTPAEEDASVEAEGAADVGSPMTARRRNSTGLAASPEAARLGAGGRRSSLPTVMDGSATQRPQPLPAASSSSAQPVPEAPVSPSSAAAEPAAESAGPAAPAAELQTRVPPLAKSAAADPMVLQDSEKRAAAAAVILMEKRLQGFVPAQDFKRLQAHVEAGFESLGTQIRSATDTQIAAGEATLEKFLAKKRVKGWLVSHPAKYNRILVCMDLRILKACFSSWVSAKDIQEAEQQ